MPRQPADQGAQVGEAFGHQPLVARLLARTPFPRDFPLPVRIREKAAPTAHLPRGLSGHRRRGPTPATPPETLKEAA